MDNDPAVSASFTQVLPAPHMGDLLAMQILGPHPRPDAAEAPGRAQQCDWLHGVRGPHDKLIFLNPARPAAGITEGMG